MIRMEASAYQGHRTEAALKLTGRLQGMLMCTGQAAHWFDHAATWKELSKRVRPGGTVAYLVCPRPSTSPNLNVSRIHHHKRPQPNPTRPSILHPRHPRVSHCYTPR